MKRKIYFEDDIINCDLGKPHEFLAFIFFAPYLLNQLQKPLLEKYFEKFINNYITINFGEATELNSFHSQTAKKILEDLSSIYDNDTRELVKENSEEFHKNKQRIFKENAK